MTDTDLQEILHDIERTLDVMNQDSGWHAPPHETWTVGPDRLKGELVASQRVILAIEGAQLQVMTYNGNLYTVSESVQLMTAGTQL